MAPCSAWSHWNLRNRFGCLVAGDGFSGLFVLLGCGAIAIGMSIAIRRGDGDWLAGVGEVGWHSLGDVADGADLHDGRLRLLQHQFLVNRANLGLLFVGLLAASALFFRGG